MQLSDFARVQEGLQQIGLLTTIHRIGKGKHRRYQAIVNFKIKKQARTRRTVKRYIIKLHNQYYLTNYGITSNQQHQGIRDRKENQRQNRKN